MSDHLKFGYYSILCSHVMSKKLKSINRKDRKVPIAIGISQRSQSPDCYWDEL